MNSMNSNNEIENTSSEKECLQSLLEVFLYIDGQLDEQRSTHIESHVKICRKCFGRVEFEKMLLTFIKRNCADEVPTDNLLESVSNIFSNPDGI